MSLATQLHEAMGEKIPGAAFASAMNGIMPMGGITDMSGTKHKWQHKVIKGHGGATDLHLWTGRTMYALGWNVIVRFGEEGEHGRTVEGSLVPTYLDSKSREVQTINNRMQLHNVSSEVTVAPGEKLSPKWLKTWIPALLKKHTRYSSAAKMFSPEAGRDPRSY